LKPDKDDIFAPLRARFERRRPIRAGSLIVTLYGDAIAPRGGSLWLGSLNALVAPFGIEPGLVRTAMSRLVTEGWFERNRVGKSSYYRLSAKGAAEFATAGERIYRAGEVPWDGRLAIVVLTSGDARTRQAVREALSGAGFGQIAPNVMVRPSRVLSPPPLPAGAGAVQLTTTAETDPHAFARLAASAWSLEPLAAAYGSFLEDIGPLARSPRAIGQLPDSDAFLLRILLIHEWRRIVLRDPCLPRELLPPDWPGTRARALCASVYRAARDGCERHLDANAVDESGRIPPAGKLYLRRFL
jgi:phenylacetic acid degradation operon negative regulatory protein